MLVFITSSWWSSSSGTKPRPPHVWALLFIVRAFFNDTITVAVWTGFHVRLMGMLSQLRDYIRRCFADPPIAAEFASGFDASNSLK
jgi:hypothetical protein